ncbi:MAG TPA: PEGA domain-containing protein [Kofleriaceae bacterium]|nr:PEGA domain-containing protein [Kofleriaceae bacterium]
MKFPLAFALYLGCAGGGALFGTGCATGGSAVRKADAALMVACPVRDARVYLDDQFVGRAGELGGRTLSVPSGTRRVEVRADGYFTAYRDVPVAKGARERLEVALRPVPVGERGE